jgi:hypothetical protein
MVVHKQKEPWWGLYDGTNAVKANLGNNCDEGDDHDDILCDEKQDKNRGDDAASVIQRVYVIDGVEVQRCQFEEYGERQFLSGLL